MTIIFGRMIGRICAFSVLSANSILINHSWCRAFAPEPNEAGHDNLPQGGAPAVSEAHATRSCRALRGVLPDAGRVGASALERHATDKVRMGSGAAARHDIRRLSRARRLLRSGWGRGVRAVRR